jgi:transposase
MSVSWTAQAKPLRGRIKRAKTDRLDARWLCVLLAKEMLPESYLPPAGTQALRGQTRVRKALAEDRTGWAQRLHALLTHEGWPCQRATASKKINVRRPSSKRAAV